MLGVSACIGIHLARMQLRLLTAKFFRTFPNAVPSAEEGMCERDLDPVIFFFQYPGGRRCLIQAW
jgi:cytochrome P450